MATPSDESSEGGARCVGGGLLIELGMSLDDHLLEYPADDGASFEEDVEILELGLGKGIVAVTEFGELVEADLATKVETVGGHSPRDLVSFMVDTSSILLDLGEDDLVAETHS